MEPVAVAVLRALLLALLLSGCDGEEPPPVTGPALVFYDPDPEFTFPEEVATTDSRTCRSCHGADHPAVAPQGTCTAPAGGVE